MVLYTTLKGRPCSNRCCTLKRRIVQLQLWGPSMAVQTHVGHLGHAASKQLDLQLSPKQ